MSTITATIDDVELTVDLAKVTGLDALAFRYAIGAELDLVVARWASEGLSPLAADLAVVKWLWIRQHHDPLAPLALVAASVPLLPTSEPSEVTVAQAAADGAAAEVVEAARAVAVARQEAVDAAHALEMARRHVADAEAAVVAARGDEDPPAAAMATVSPQPDAGGPGAHAESG